MTGKIAATFTCFALLSAFPGVRVPAAAEERGRSEAVKAPAFTLPALDGEAVTLAAALEESEVILVFWATWCPPCVRSLPDLREFHASEAAREKKTREKRVRLFSVNLDEERRTLKAFAERQGMNWPVLLDAGVRVARAYGVRGVPTVVLVGRDGKIRHTGHSFREMADKFYPGVLKR